MDSCCSFVGADPLPALLQAKPYYASPNLQKFMSDHKKEQVSATKLEG